MWISAAFTFAGAALALTIVFVALRGALRAANPGIWETQYASETYISYAWQELGRGLFLGYFFALGLSPVTASFFLGQRDFWQSFAFLSVINWALSAIVIYFVQLVPGFWGYVRRRQRHGGLSGLSLLTQMLVVFAMSVPLGWLFLVVLLPPAEEFFQVLVHFWQFFIRAVL